MKKIENSQKFGCTETGEIAFNLEAFNHLYEGNLIITKRLTDELIKKLVEYKEKCILHLTVTGHGGDILEPLSPSCEQSYKQFLKLIKFGFPLNQVVLRIDPIIPTEKGIKIAMHVIDVFKDSGITRVRISFLDMYNHVKERFNKIGIKFPYETFHAPLEIRKKYILEIQELGKKYGFEVEACGEPGIKSISCLSQKDVDILGLTNKIILQGNAEQRKNCNCPANKAQILGTKPQQCENKCLYCFWK